MSHWANSDSQDSPQPGLGGDHHLLPYSILCASPRGPHPNDILSLDSQMGVPKFPKLGLRQLGGPIALCANFQLRWGLKQSYSSHREISNGMSHATWTQGNRVDSRLLVVKVTLPIWLPTFLLAITCVLSVQMGHATPFKHLCFNRFSMI